MTDLKALPSTIYARFSGHGQRQGTSIERQVETGRAAAIARGWLPDKEPLLDQANSAYHGINRAEGAELYEFERKAKAGHFRYGRGFMCENIDRISREGWRQTYEFIENCTQNGVTVVTYHDGETFEAGKSVDMMKVIKLILNAERAREESATKGKRTGDNWARKHEAARKGSKKAISRKCPHWLRVDETGCYAAIEARAELLRTIYEWATDGFGSPRIATRLNEEGFQVWGKGKKGWQDSYVTELLTTRAVLGEYQPMTVVSHKPFRQEQNGPPIADLYPQVIDADLYNRVQAARAERKGKGGRRGNTQANIFQGIAKCAECGGSMTFNSTRVKGRVVRGVKRASGQVIYTARVGFSTLRCNNAARTVRDGNGAALCTNKSAVRYEHIEPAVLDRLLHLALDNVHFLMPDRVAGLEVGIAETERRVINRKAQLVELAKGLSLGFSMAVHERILALEAEQVTDRARIQELREQSAIAHGEVSTDEHIARVNAVRASLDDEDVAVRFEARVLVNQALRRIVTSMTCDAGRATSVVVANGLAQFRFDREGNELQNGRGLRVYRKEYQTEGLKCHEGNAARVDAIVERIEKLTGRERGNFVSEAALKLRSQ